MWYAIICEDVENSLPLRKLHRPAHLERLRPLIDKGRVLVAGPHPRDDSAKEGFSGSLLVVKFESLAEAKQWTETDPYVLNGVYENVVVKPFTVVFPDIED